MSKTETTRDLERLLCRQFDTRSEFFVFECTLGWYGKEIVDCIMYNCAREVACYEIKSSVADFRSKSAKTFIGNRNYFVMPREVFEKVKDEIPKGIGVYVPNSVKARDGRVIYNQLVCVRSCRKRELGADKEVILSSMLRCMQRDNGRWGLRGCETKGYTEKLYESVSPMAFYKEGDGAEKDYGATDDLFG